MRGTLRTLRAGASTTRPTRSSSAICAGGALGAASDRGGASRTCVRRRVAVGPYGDIIDQRAFYELHEGGRPLRPRAPGRGAATRTNGDLAALRRRRGRRRVRARPRRGRGAERPCASRQPRLQGERRARPAVHADALRGRPGVDPYAIGAGEEAVGDRYNRGGGALAKAIAECCGLVERQRQRREGLLHQPRCTRSSWPARWSSRAPSSASSSSPAARWPSSA